MRSLTLILTTGCNLRCTYCYADNPTGEEMTWEIARTAIDVLARAGNPRPRIFFYGGEPLLRFPLIRKVVNHIRSEYGPEFSPQYVLCTNGTLLNRAILDELAEYDLRIQLSSDGVRAAQNDRGEHSFDAVDELLTTLAREYNRFFRENVEIKMTLTGANLPMLHQSLVYLMGMGAATISVVPLTTHDPDWCDESRRILSAQIDRVRRLCLERKHDARDVPVQFLRSSSGHSPKRLNPDIHCGIVEGNEIVVEPDGGAVACPAFVGSHQTLKGMLHSQTMGAASIGDVKNSDFSRKFSLCRKTMRHQAIFQKSDCYSSYGRCDRCAHYHDCFICPSSIAHIPGNTDPHRIPDNQCAFNLVVGRQRELFREAADRHPAPLTPRSSIGKTEDPNSK